MAKGETRYSSAGKPVHRFINTPIPAGPYPMELLGDGLETKKSADAGPDAIPYINSRFAAHGTEGDKAGAKPRLVFHKFFIGLKPGSDGIVMPERGGGIVEYCRSFGEEADFALKTITLETPLEDGTGKIDYFDPDEVLEYLKNKVGEVKNAHVVIEIQKDQFTKKPVIGPDKKPVGQNKVGHWELDAETTTGEEEPEFKKAPLKKSKK